MNRLFWWMLWFLECDKAMPLAVSPLFCLRRIGLLYGVLVNDDLRFIICFSVANKVLSDHS